MACCGAARAVTPVVRRGLPTVWAWIPHTEEYVVITDPEEALRLIEESNGELS